MKLFKQFIFGISLIFFFTNVAFGQNISIALTTNNSGEDAGPNNVTLTISSDNATTLGADVTVDLTFSGASLFGTDYTVSPTFTNGGSVTIPTSSSINASATYNISYTPDTYLEGDEDIIASISNAAGGGGAPSITTASGNSTITDAEFVELATSAPSIAEAAGVTNYTAQVSGGGQNKTGVVITVNINWSSGTATPTTDFTGHLASTTIAIDGITSANIPVTAVSDRLLEGGETIGAVITGLTGAPAGTGSSGGTVSTTITDDEFIILAATTNSIPEAAGTSDITAVVSGVGTVGANFENKLGGDIAITLDWAFGGPTATNTVDYTRSAENLTILNNATSSAATTVTAIQDNLIEPDETVRATISAASLGAQVGGPDFQIITIVDDDPMLVAPGNTLTGVSLFPTFSWVDDGVSSYEVQVSTSPTFATTLAVQNVGSGVSSYQFLEDHASGAFPLNNSTVYYWRVLANGTEYSEIWSFKTVEGISIGVGNPANGSEVYQYDPLYFSWYIAQAQGSIKFRLEIIASGTDPTPSVWKTGPWTVSVDNISAVYKTINGLSGGTKYYWRLIGYIDTNTDNTYDPSFDKVVVFSQHYNFTTKGGAVTAYPSWPIGGNKVYTLTPMFGWYTLNYEPAATYQIIIAKDATLTGGYLQTQVVGTYPASPQSGMTYTIPTGELDYSTTYYWQVVTHYASSQVYSSVATFTTFDDVSAVVNKPVISYPTGGATIYTDSPTLYWWGNSYGSSINYSVEYSTTGGAPYTVWGTTTGTQSLSVSGLTAGQTYTWIVVADKGGPSEVTSDPATFVVAGGSSSYPVPTFPTGGATVYSTTPTLGWYVSGSTLGWTGYYVKWKKTSGVVSDWAAEPLGTVINDINQTNVTVSPALEEGETYKWAVALYDGVTPPVHAKYVETSFVVYGGASSITINQSTPANGAVGVSTNVYFSWWVSGSLTSITGYFVQYSPYADPTLDPNLATQVSSTSTNTFANLTLAGGTTYKWRVVANLSSGGPVYSGWYEFTTLATSLAVQPTVGSPSNGVELSNKSVELSWFTKVAPLSSQNYLLEIADDKEFSNIITSKEIEATNLVVSDLENGTYFWRVKGKNSEGESVYSPAESFKIGNGITDVAGNSIIPTEFKVEQNYPNPFNPSTVISYSLSEASFITIKIYDMLGREVKTLVSSDRLAGRYSVSWNGLNNNGVKVSSGTYIYRVVAGNNIDTKKMVLLK